MAELSTGEFARECGCTLKNVNAKMKKLSITGVKSEIDRRLTLLSDEEQDLLRPYLVKKKATPEAIGEFVDSEIVEPEEIGPITNTALSFHVPDLDADIEAIRLDGQNLATQTQSNFSAFRNANLSLIRQAARRDAAIAIQVYESEFQSSLNDDLTGIYGTQSETKSTTSNTVKKQVGQS